MKRNHVIGPLKAEEVERVVKLLANAAAGLRRRAMLGMSTGFNRIAKYDMCRADELAFAAREVAIAARRGQ